MITMNYTLPMPSPIMARDGNVVFFAYWVDEIDAYKFIVWGEGKDTWNPEKWVMSLQGSTVDKR